MSCSSAPRGLRSVEQHFTLLLLLGEEGAACGVRYFIGRPQNLGRMTIQENLLRLLQPNNKDRKTTCKTHRQLPVMLALVANSRLQCLSPSQQLVLRTESCAAKNVSELVQLPCSENPPRALTAPSHLRGSATRTQEPFGV